jgi:hypothetical protein
MRYWVDERKTLLRGLYPTASREEVLEAFPEKNWNAISAKATREKIHRKVPHKFKVRDFPIMDKVTARIMAWAISLEGAITLHKQTDPRTKTPELYAVVSLANTNRNLLTKLMEISGFGHIRSKSWQYNERCKPCFYWTIRNIQECLAFLRQIQPHLPSKQEQADLLIEYCEERLKNWRLPYSTRDFEIHERIKSLNKRGLK